MREGAMRYLEEAKYNSDTGKRLKEIRIANHYTQQVVADEMGIGLDYYKKLEAGKKNVQLL
jgi:transcriptional regulator with XRE-family HTH domain